MMNRNNVVRTPQPELFPNGRKGRRRAPSKARTISIETFVNEIYMPAVRARKRSWDVDERIANRYLFPAFGGRPMHGIARAEVEDWLRGLYLGGLAKSTCNRILAVFKTICSTAELRGVYLPGFGPCRGVPPYRILTVRERYLSQEEARALMAELEKSPRPEAYAIRLLMLTGARKSEILRARWEDVHLDRRQLTVPLSKSGRPRHIVLSEMAMEVLRGIPRVPGSQWLFPGCRKDRPRADIYPFWEQVRSSLGLRDVRLHDLRHSFASFLVNAGHSLYEVQKMLGHGDPRTTMRYAHLDQRALIATAETVSGVFNRM